MSTDTWKMKGAAALSVASGLLVASLILAGCQMADESGQGVESGAGADMAVGDKPVLVVEAPVPESAATEEQEPVEQAEPVAAEEPAEATYQQEWSEPYYGGQSYQPYYGGNDYGNSFKSEGVIYDNGVTYTWYSQNAAPGGGLTELNNSGRHVDASTGFIVDGEGYIAVASSDYAQGDIVQTPWGEGKVYDTGCAPGVIDIYTDF